MVLQDPDTLSLFRRLLERVWPQDLLYQLSDVEDALDKALLGLSSPIPLMEALMTRHSLKQPSSRYLYLRLEEHL